MENFKEYIRSHGYGPLPAYEEVDDLLTSYPWFTTARVVRAAVSENRGATDVLLKLHRSVKPLSASRLYRVTAADFETIGQSSDAQRADGEGHLLSFSQAQESDQISFLPKVSGSIPIQPEEPAGTEMPHPRQATQEQIIDKFLSLGEHRISPPQDGSMPEVELPDMDFEAAPLLEIVTEELADIYMEQQLWQQAKEVYKKLSLLYPKKSVYFAEIIERINAQTQEQNN